MVQPIPTPTVFFGTDWYADRHGNVIDLYVSPEGDPLPRALDGTLPPDVQAEWSLFYVGEDAAGWFVWRLEHEPDLA